VSSGDAWHARRALGFGASDVAALLLASGAVAEPAPRYLADRAKVITRGPGRGLPRIIAEKAGVVEPLKAGGAAARGTSRERELLEHWRELLRREQYSDEGAEGALLPESVTHADMMLASCWPLVDRHQPRLTATLDAWARDAMGCEAVVECKCTATDRTSAPWYWVAQVQAQLAVSGADYGLLLVGEFWAAWHGNDGPVRVWAVERDETAIALIRELVARSWEAVEAARSAALQSEAANGR